MQKSQKEPAGNYGLLFQPFSFYLAENRSKKFGDRLAGGCQRVMLEGDGCIAGKDYVLWYAVMIETEPNPAMWNDISGTLKMSNKSEFSWN